MIPTIIDVAISLIVVFFLLSTLVSFINEIIALIISSRGKLLRNSLENLVGDESDDDSLPLIQKLYESSHIYKLRIFKSLRSKGYLPANISSDSFANAILELINDKVPLDNLVEIKERISSKLPEGFLKKKLLALIAELKPENLYIAGFKEKIQEWYNGYMDTVTRVYKLKTRVIIFIISVLLCFIMNIDTLSLSQYFWKNKTAREQMVSYAQGLEKGTFSAPKVIAVYDTIKRFEDGSMHIDTTMVELTDEERYAATQKETKDILAQLKSFNLPISWSTANLKSMGFWGILLKLLGIMVTACCLTLGAPFWFQLMQRLIKAKDTVFTGKSGGE